MAKDLKEPQARDLCVSLLAAESETDVIRILTETGLWDDDTAWRYFGDNENNFSIIGNQQSNPAAAMVEKLVNSVDAVLMRECYLHDTLPDGPDAPHSTSEAIETYFNIRAGNLANVTTTRRRELAEDIGFIATGRKQTPNYTVFDRGEGQTPDSMPNTLLSLAKSNKLRIPFVQGKFNMGGTGVLQFCGKRNLELIISHRHPDIAGDDMSAEFWGFTLIRREDPEQGRRSSAFKYLAPAGRVPRFRGQVVQLPDLGEGGPLPSLQWGTIIKMYEYEMTGLKTHIRLDLYTKIALLLPRIGLPIRFIERRDYRDDSDVTMSGLHVRLEDNRRDSIEEGFPTESTLVVAGQSLLISIFAFRKGSSEAFRSNEGIIFTLNGQTHGILPRDFFTRRSVGMSYLADSLLVSVECDAISGRAREDLFMNSRDRLRSGDLRTEIESALEELLREHQGLRELRERRRREDITGKLSDTRPLQDVLNEIFRKSPTLTTLFVEGKDLKNPFRSRLDSETSKFEGKPYPSFFQLRKGEAEKTCHLNLRFRVQFETDVVNDYFGRDEHPGTFALRINGQLTDDYSLSLWNGIATLTVTLPPGVALHDVLYCETWVEDDVSVEPFYNQFTRHVLGPIKPSGHRSNAQHPEPSSRSETPEGLSLPNVFEVHENEWDAYNFDKFSALRAVDSGQGFYDFYVNIDNLYLQTEVKSLQKNVNVELLKARFKYGLVLAGIALLKDHEDHAPSDNDEVKSETAEEYVSRVSKALAAVLLPMINVLGEASEFLEIGGEMTEDT